MSIENRTLKTENSSFLVKGTWVPPSGKSFRPLWLYRRNVKNRRIIPLSPTQFYHIKMVPYQQARARRCRYRSRSWRTGRVRAPLSPAVWRAATARHLAPDPRLQDARWTAVPETLRNIPAYSEPKKCLPTRTPSSVVENSSPGVHILGLGSLRYSTARYITTLYVTSRSKFVSQISTNFNSVATRGQ